MDQSQSPTKIVSPEDVAKTRGQWNRRSLLRGLGGASVLGAAVAIGHTNAVSAQTDDRQNGTLADTDAGASPGLVVPSASRSDLTDSDATTAGRLVRVIDEDRSLWLDTGAGWVSVGGEVFNVRAFGAVGDGRTDDWGAFHAAIEAMSSPLLDDSTTPYGRTLLVPPGRYRLAQSLVINRAIHLRGSGRTGDAILSPDPGLIGVIIQGGDVLTGGAAGRVADGAIIEGIRIEVGTGSTAADAQAPTDAASEGRAHGLWLQTRATIRDCAVVGFPGNGIHIEAVAVASGDTNQFVASAADGWVVESSLVQGNTGHGLFTTASGGVCSALDATENGGWGIDDESRGGNSYLQCRADANETGSIQTTGTSNRSVIVGCASERGQQPSQFGPQTIVVGGRLDAGYVGGNAWTANGSRVSLIAQEPGAGETAPTLAVRGSQAQTQPHLLVTDAGGQAQAVLDSAGRLALGPLAADGDVSGEENTSDLLLHLSDNQGSGRAGIRWLVADTESDFTGWVAQVRALADVAGPDDPNAEMDFTRLRLTFQTPAEDGSAYDTLTLRAGSVGIGTNTPAAALEIASTSSGFLPPRLSPEQRDAIVAPPEGSVIFNTSSKRLNTFDGSVWREEGGLNRLTADQRDEIDAPGEGSMIYNLTSKRLNFYDGDSWLEVAVAQNEE